MSGFQGPLNSLEPDKNTHVVCNESVRSKNQLFVPNFWTCAGGRVWDWPKVARSDAPVGGADLNRPAVCSGRKSFT